MKGDQWSNGENMFLIKIVVDDGTELLWEYDNRMDFEKWLDKLVLAHDNGVFIEDTKIYAIKICIARLWIRVR